MSVAGARRFAAAGLPLAAMLLGAAPRAAGAQSPPVPVVAVGEGSSFAAALSAAVRMAVESGAGATVVGAVSSHGEAIVGDIVRAVSRGVVTRYAVTDSSVSGGATHVRIIAMVSRISKRGAVGARARRVAAPGMLWIANAALDVDRRADEGRLLDELFGTIDNQPSAYAYEIEAGPPVADGAKLRLRLRVIRSPSPAYDALRDRARSLLAAIAGPGGTHTTHLPPLDSEQRDVRPCVSYCAPGERRVLNARAALDDTDSLGTFDPPVVTGTGEEPVRTLFPDLRTVGGFAVAFTDSSRRRQQFVHVRSTRGYLAVVDYLRTTFDDARLRIGVGGRSVDVLESFRATWTGQPQPRITTTGGPGSVTTALVQGFRPRTGGGPGAPTTLGSPYVVLAVPAAASVPADTARIDLWLTPGQLSRLAELSVQPLATNHRLPAIACPPTRAPRNRRACVRPGALDPATRTLDEPRAPPEAAASTPPAPGARSAPADPFAFSGAGAHPPGDQPAVPPAVLDALAHQPLSDGDGAISLSSPRPLWIAVSSATVDPAAPAQACAVARLRAQRELARIIAGSRVEARTGLSASETRGGQVQESFHENISETVEARIAGAALAAQWTVAAPPRCRVALWLPANR